jgi:hypothetical protein
MLAAHVKMQPIQDDFSLGRESTKDQHNFRSEYVDEIGNFLVVEEQVDELRDLDVVDGDRGSARRRDAPVRFASLRSGTAPSLLLL